jgi:hypothetical protein
VATASGVAFTLIFFGIFLASERINERRRKAAHVETDKFRLHPRDTVSFETVGVRPGNTLCLVRDYNKLGHLSRALELTDTTQKDLVVMTVHVTKGPHAGYADIDEERLFTKYEELLFTRVVALAEKAGKTVSLLVVPSSNFLQATALTAAQLDSAEIVAGRSPVMPPEEQAKLLGRAWEELPNKPDHPVNLLVVGAEGRTDSFYVGAHAPELTPAEVELIHKIWLDVTREECGESLRHNEVVRFALVRLERDLQGMGRLVVIAQLCAPRRKQTPADAKVT